MDKTKKLVAAAIIVTIITVASISIFIILRSRSEPQQLKYNARLIERFEPVQGEDELTQFQTTYYLELCFYNEPTLFRGAFDLDYMTKDGSWISESRDVGIVDNNWADTCWEIHLENYASEEAITFTQDFGEKSFHFNETTTLETIAVHAYGYLNP
jgi:hypothetical protein